MQLALEIVSQGGAVVVHDCNPPYREVAAPAPPPIGGYWCGDTWRAFVDVTAGLEADCSWLVVDSDFGIGVIEVGARPRERWSAPPATERVGVRGRGLPREWSPEQAWSWLDDNRSEVLRLITPKAWRERDARARSAEEQHWTTSA